MSSVSATLPTVPVYDYAIFLSLTALSLARQSRTVAGTGLYLSLRRRVRGVSTKDEAFLGSRSLHVMPLALSMVATNVSAMGTIGWVAYFYMHGFHTFWCIPAFVPAGILFCYLLLPVLYQLKVTSIFEYLRMRYGNGVGVASSLIYFMLSQTSGAAEIYSAAIALSTSKQEMSERPFKHEFITPDHACPCVRLKRKDFSFIAREEHKSSQRKSSAQPFLFCRGGLRSVVWADCVQAVIMTAAPLTIIGKIVYDSARSANPPRPLGDLNFTTIILRLSVHMLILLHAFLDASTRTYYDFACVRTEFDFTTDETVWAGFLAAFPVQLMCVGLDQAIAQRFLAARSLTQAKKVALGGVILLAYCYTLHGLTGLAMVYWYRDCDPVLSGSITRYDQIVPYYINKSASSIEGFRGLFLAGLVSASISTVSSVVNSHAAVLYVDIVSPYIRISKKKLGFVMAGLAISSGTVMILFGLLIPQIGSAARFFIALHSAATGPFVGIIILAFFFPWANGKGSAVAALGVFVLQIWQTTGRFLSRITPARRTYGLYKCPGNYTLHEEASNGNREHADALLLYRISSYWFSLLTVCLTVVLGLTFSLLCPSSTNEIRDAARLSSPLMLKFWRRVGLLRHVSKEHRETSEMVHNDAALEVRPLQTTKEDDNLTSCMKTWTTSYYSRCS
ncbi:sodium-coupled monocarboxylate transporter 1-like [Rhipicephalus microplus]|uniref:sodium-coupled monocarboxylate transporter 1-like n=1 Tax=Rhipicephalus microplus TaxID=6941 RepID=UPI003F6D1961